MERSRHTPTRRLGMYPTLAEQMGQLVGTSIQFGVAKGATLKLNGDGVRSLLGLVFQELMDTQIARVL